MGSGHIKSRLSHLWQLPLLLASLILFTYAAYLFIDPKAPPTIGQHIEAAQRLIDHERYESAIEHLNRLLKRERLEAKFEGAIRMLLGEALDMAQRQRRIRVPANFEQIIVQTNLATKLGIAPDARSHRRLAESYEALGKVAEAIENYSSAIALGPEQSAPLRRKVIELQLLSGQHEQASAGIESHLELPELSQSERAWAMGEKAHLLVDRGAFQEARQLLADAMKLEGANPADQGQFYYWLGYCDWKLGNHGEAERSMRVARDLLQVRHPLDAEAAYALGRIRQDQDDLTGAMSFYASVLQSHLDKPVAWSAKLARAICRLGMGETDAGLADLHEVVRRVEEKPAAQTTSLRQEAIAALREAEQLLSDASRFEASLEVMSHEQRLEPKPGPEFFGRLAQVYERLAEQVEQTILDLSPQEQAAQEQRVRKLRAKAGDGYVAYSRALTLIDDKAYGQTLWKGVELYERAGDVERVIAALRTFVNERPNDPQAPAAMLKLGHSYHATGQFDDAIKAYRDNQFRYPNSLAAAKSGVPLARAYIAKGPDYYRKAEEVLLSVVENNPQVTPEAEEFRESLWELANLYYRGGQYESAVARLEEVIQRYPGDERLGQLRFLMADSYRKSAAMLDQKIADARATAATKPAVDVAEAIRAKTERLARAADLYAQVIDQYRRRNSSKDLDRLYLKLSHFYRADCMFDLGNYEEAIRLYGDAAFRYQDDASTLAAYVQIVNANVELGRMDEAKAANERAKWLLRRMPGEAFSDSSFGGTKAHWEQWLKWSGEIGMWK